MNAAGTLVLQCGGTPLHVAPACGKTYRIVAGKVSVCGTLVNEALRSPAVEVVPAFGGLLERNSVLENILLPALYHRRIPAQDVAERAYRAFACCGIERLQADALCARSVQDLGKYDRRLVALVRSLLMRPALLLLERLFEGLTAQDKQRAARFGGYYRGVVPDGTLIYCDLAGISCPDVAADEQVEAP